MRPLLLVLGFCFLAAAAPLLARLPPLPSPSHWSHAQVGRLVDWLRAAADDGLEAVTPYATKVQTAADGGDQAAVDEAATTAAVALLQAHRRGCCAASLRTGWHIGERETWSDPATAVRAAVDTDMVDALFGEARPSHAFYQALRAAYARESDPARRATLAANLDRWRWMPRQLSQRYLLVNTAAFEATLWDGASMIGRWQVIVGKTRSPTPVFAATVTGITFNPWWEIPSAIAAEGVAALIRDHPAEAAAKGYVLDHGRYRQRPGATNALGSMKLAMPNSFHVYLHDTPAKALFAQDVRAYSHGCVRVGDALGLATALLSTRPGWDRAAVDAAVATRRTQTVQLGAPVPVYIAYFTAEPDENAGIRYFPDIYHRDRGAPAPDGGDGTHCFPNEKTP